MNKDIKEIYKVSVRISKVRMPRKIKAKIKTKCNIHR